MSLGMLSRWNADSPPALPTNYSTSLGPGPTRGRLARSPSSEPDASDGFFPSPGPISPSSSRASSPAPGAAARSFFPPTERDTSSSLDHSPGSPLGSAIFGPKGGASPWSLQPQDPERDTLPDCLEDDYEEEDDPPPPTSNSWTPGHVVPPRGLWSSPSDFRDPQAQRDYSAGLWSPPPGDRDTGISAVHSGSSATGPSFHADAKDHSYAPSHLSDHSSGLTERVLPSWLVDLYWQDPKDIELLLKQTRFLGVEMPGHFVREGVTFVMGLAAGIWATRKVSGWMKSVSDFLDDYD